jgi:hypothetical protein
MKQIIKGFRIYKTAADRMRARTMLKRRGFNVFVFYVDVQGYGLNYY